MPRKSEIVNQNLRAMARYEGGLIKPLTNARDAFGLFAIEGMATTGIDIEAAKVAYTAEVLNILSTMAERAIPEFGRMTEAEITSTKARIIQRKQMDFETLYRQWVNTRLFQHSQLIANTASNEVTAIVQQLLGADETIRTVEDAIRDYSSLSRSQSALIARTETHQAAMFAKKETSLDLQNRTGVEMLKFWNPVEDSRTRPDHAAMNSRKGIGLDEKFMVGGEPMDRPGDSGASASQVINCRCVLSTRPKGF